MPKEKPKRVGLKILQCNDEMCQYELRPDGNIGWTAQSTNSVRFTWDSPPKTALIIKKPGSPESSSAFVKVSQYLNDRLKIKVLVEPAVIAEFPAMHYLINLVEETDPDDADRKATSTAPSGPAAYSAARLRSADFVVCIGGDGTILWVSGLYKGPCPPIVSFAMGSLGFLTPFDYADHQAILDEVVSGAIQVGVRTRLQALVHDDQMRLVGEFIALNEINVDRGPSPYLCNVECSCDDRVVTLSQGDGIIIATPTGSTAYSLAAGGSMVHPDVPALLLTPICSHALAFRPMIFPDSVTLRLKVPDDSSFPAWASFDGKNGMTMYKGWSVTARVSKWPVPIMSHSAASATAVGGSAQRRDWFDGVMECLHWNNRTAQGALAPPPVATPATASSSADGSMPHPVPSAATSASKQPRA